MSQLCADAETETEAEFGSNDDLRREKAAAAQACHPEPGVLMSLTRV